MEAWDTLAAVEDGLATLRGSADPTAVVEHLAVVTHRLRGSAALSGFPQVAGLAAAMEGAVERVGATPPGTDRRALASLGDMVFWLKTALDGIGETGVEDAEAIAESLAGLVPSTPPPPADETSRRLAERSGKAAKDIVVLIKAVQAETQQAVVAMEEGTREVEAGFKVTVEAGERLHQIGEISQKSAALALEISQATQDQVRGVEGGAVAVQSIAGVAVETEKAVVETRKTMDQMVRVAEALTASLARFKLSS